MANVLIEANHTVRVGVRYVPFHLRIEWWNLGCRNTLIGTYSAKHRQQLVFMMPNSGTSG
jgi:hypothetical protein